LNAALGTEYSEWCWYPQGDTYGNYGYAMTTIDTSHTVSSTIDDACKVSVEGQSNVSAERILSLRALAQSTGSPWTGTSHDNGAATTNGGSVYIQATEATGNIEVSIRHSTNNFAGDDTELASFTVVTGTKSERITFSGTVKRYVRGFAEVNGGETITFNLAISRK
jgi:hypothetical protein